MVVFGTYGSVLALLFCSSAASLCFALYAVFKHKPALWLSLCMIGLGSFGLSILGAQIGLLASIALPGALRLVFVAFGTILIVNCLPRFFLSAFGTSPRRLHRILLDAATVIAAALWFAELVTGWEDLARVPAIVLLLNRIFIYGFLSGTFGLAFLFQSHLPDRNLYKTLIIQVCAAAILLPLIFLEDLGVIGFDGVYSLALDALMASVSISAIFHARASFMRPKYVAGEAPSPYFIERFGISERELEVVTGVLGGLANKDIADRLFISPKTVENHLYRIYQKLGINNRLQLYNLLRSDSR